MNEIIVDFDEILDDEKFQSIEKIKTVGKKVSFIRWCPNFKKKIRF